MISKTELLILLVLHGATTPGVYGLDIQKAILECGNETLSTGSLYFVLKRLRSSGYITSTEGQPMAGGARRQYYSLTTEGISVLSQTLEFISNLHNWVSEPSRSPSA